METKPLKYILFSTCFVRRESWSVIVLIEPLAILLLIAIFSAVEVRPHPHVARVQSDVWTLQLGLTADLVWEFDHRLGGISSNFRRRARYLLFCSTWTILAAVILAIVSLGASSAAAVAIAVVYARSFLL